MMGAPTVMLEKLPSGQEALLALRTLETHLGKRVKALLSVEAGGLNSTIPIGVASELGLPLVDADGMGRAFPELQMVVMTLHGIKATPMGMADEKGNAALIETIDNRWTERLARTITIEMGGSSLTALYPMTGKQAEGRHHSRHHHLARADWPRQPARPGRRTAIRWKRCGPSPAASTSSRAR